jgi:hypothetical protein
LSFSFSWLLFLRPLVGRPPQYYVLGAKKFVLQAKEFLLRDIDKLALAGYTVFGTPPISAHVVPVTQDDARRF